MLYLSYLEFYIYIYIYIYNSHDKQNAQISQKQDRRNIYAIMKTMCRFCGNSCTWAHDVWLHIAGTDEPKSAQQSNQGA